MRYPGNVPLLIQVSDLAAPWLRANCKNKPLKIEWSDLMTSYLYWTAQCPRVSDASVEPGWQKIQIQIAHFHHRRWNFFKPGHPQEIFSILETRPWVKYVEWLLRQELYQYMQEVGQIDGFNLFSEKYGYLKSDKLDMEREIRTFHNHRSTGMVAMFSCFPFEKNRSA